MLSKLEISLFYLLSSYFLLLTSHLLHHLRISFHITTRNEFCFNRQFTCGKFQSFLCNQRSYTIYFKKYATRFHNSCPKLEVAFSFSHPYFKRLACDWFIRKNPDPYISL